MKKIAFHTNELNLRGTNVALYDYAHYNEQLLNNTSYIISNKNADMSAYKKFIERWPSRVLLYDNFSEVDRFLKKENIEFIYYIKAGSVDGKMVSNAKNLIHAVFQHYEPHGEKYVYIAQWLAKKMCNDVDNFVPHVLELPPCNVNLRQKLNIPETATVIGRHGGYDEFNFYHTIQAVIESLNKRQDLYYIFMNTRPFVNHPRVFFIEGTYNLQHKSNFISMCDCMIHGRQQGETFGLAIGEFLFFDKPIILSTQGNDEGHHYMVGDKGFWYNDYSSCLTKILEFNKTKLIPGTYKALVSQYTPQKVMEQFNSKFLEG
jgi:hypothetical protein